MADNSKDFFLKSDVADNKWDESAAVINKVKDVFESFYIIRGPSRENTRLPHYSVAFWELELWDKEGKD
jgi:hypothetical protein